MGVPRFHVSGALSPGGQAEFDDEQAHQARSVLRLRPGDAVVVFDGSGAEGKAVVTTMTRGVVAYEVQSVERPEREPPLRLRVGLALLRGERFDMAVQKLTEIGVDRITPLAADRSVVSFPDAADWERRAARLERIAREAAEQSERVSLPIIDAPLTLGALLRDGPVACLVERDDALPAGALGLGRAMTIAVGPEGGWSPAERSLMLTQGAGQMSLGRLILRSETAAIVAAGTLLQRAWHELNGTR